MEKNRSQRKLPGGSPPVVTYSRQREEDLPDVYDDERAAAAFEPELVAEWEAVEVPPAPPLHARRRSRPLVEEVRAPVDPDRFPDERLNDERPPRRERAGRSTGMRLVAVAALAAVVVGVGILYFAFSSSGPSPVTAPTLSEDGAAPGTVPADEAGQPANAVREIPLNSDGSADPAAPAPQPVSTQPAEAEPVNTVPVAPPVPRARPEPPAVQPDFDQAAPLPQPSAPAAPVTATAPASPAGDQDFIANIERTLQQSRGANEPALSPTTDQPLVLAPPTQQLLPPQQQLLPPPPPPPGFSQPQAFPEPVQAFPQQQPQQGQFVPPENIPMIDGQSQPILLPGDLLLDTE